MRTHVAALAGALLLAAPFGVALAADESDGAKVLATVNGEAITESDYQLAKESLPEEYKAAPDEMLREALLGRLVDQKLIAAAARADGLTEDPEVAARAAHAAEQVYLNAWLGRRILAGVPDEKVREIYDARIAALNPVEEVNARHILVETEEAAKQIKAELDAGADFAELAKEKSTGPSGPSGGDLGWFTRERMVPEFSAAAFALDKGGVSEPVKSQFGWHVIKLEDRRAVPPPPFEELVDEIRSDLAQGVIRAELEALRAGAKIERVGLPGPEAAAEAPAGEAPAGEAPAGDAAPKQ